MKSHAIEQTIDPPNSLSWAPPGAMGGVSVETANRLLETVTDFEVKGHFDDGARQRPPRSVKWADLADTDAEYEECARITVGRKGVLGFARESQSDPRAGAAGAAAPLAASVETGRADGRLARYLAGARGSRLPPQVGSHPVRRLPATQDAARRGRIPSHQCHWVSFRDACERSGHVCLQIMHRKVGR